MLSEELIELANKPICSAEIPAVDLVERPCYYSGAGRVKGSYVRVGNEKEKQNESAKDLLEFCKEPRTRKEIAEYLGIGTIFYAMKNYVQPLVDTGKLKLTIPEKPKSRNQKFFVPTEKMNM